MYYIQVLFNRILKNIFLIFLNRRNIFANYNRFIDEWHHDTTQSSETDVPSFTRDDELMALHRRMKHHNVSVGQRFHQDFFSFLESHPDMYRRFIVMSTSPRSSSIEDVDDIVAKFNKIRSVYTFKQLYEIDSEWYSFFKENTDPSGNVNDGEGRIGVDKQYVDDIMQIKTLSGCDLFSAVVIYTNILYRIYNAQYPVPNPTLTLNTQYPTSPSHSSLMNARCSVSTQSIL